MNFMRRVLGTGTAICLLTTGCALADSISFTGTVVAGTTTPVFSQIGGTVESINVALGQAVCQGDSIATLKTNKVYASADGTVTGVFAQLGDSLANVQNRFGAVLYVEGTSRYTIAASTTNAYNTTANKYVHVGENVYLSCYTDSGSHTGTGTITSISGTDYSVEVLSGEFVIGETVSIFREEDCATSSRIGRGTLSRSNPTSYGAATNGATGSNESAAAETSIVAINVTDGEAVQRGDLLYETLDGTYSAYYMSGTEYVSPIDGYIAELDMSEGSAVNADSVIAKIYPLGSMRISATVSESDLAYIAEGDTVEIELNWNQDEDICYSGVVSMISSIADSASSDAQTEMNVDTSETNEVSYTVYIDFTADENTRYGMSAVITTLDDGEILDPEVEDTELTQAEDTSEGVQE